MVFTRGAAQKTIKAEGYWLIFLYNAEQSYRPFTDIFSLSYGQYFGTGFSQTVLIYDRDVSRRTFADTEHDWREGKTTTLMSTCP